MMLNSFTRRVTRSRRGDVQILRPLPLSRVTVDYIRGIIEAHSRFRRESGGAWQV
jgi:hypothetical protein